MPTSRPHRTVTETPPVQAVLDELRAARERLVREIREGHSEVDVAAADEVKRLGLIVSDR